MGQCLKPQFSSRTELSGFEEQEEGQSEIADPRQDLFSVDLFREFCVMFMDWCVTSLITEYNWNYHFITAGNNDRVSRRPTSMKPHFDLTFYNDP